MHLRAALARGLLDLLIEREIGKRADGDDDQVHAALEHRNGHRADGFHRRGFHDVFRLEREQRVHIRAGRTADGFGHLLRRFRGTAGHAHQLIIRQQAVFPCAGHNAAQKAAADDAEFRFHMFLSFCVAFCNGIAFIISWIHEKNIPFFRNKRDAVSEADGGSYSPT